jgi:hypothetical protein
MALESASYISGLVSTNPSGSDAISQGDDHLRLIKAVLKASLPNAYEAINGIHTGTSAPSSTSAGQLWFDTSTNLLKMRNEADSGWIVLSGSEGNSIINIATYEDSTGGNIRSTSFTDAYSFSYTKLTSTSDLIFHVNIFAGLYNYGTLATGDVRLWDADNSARIGGFVWDAGGEWNNLGASPSNNNEIRAYTSFSVKESTPLSAGTKNFKIQALMDQPSNGGYAYDDLSVVVMEVE